MISGAASQVSVAIPAGVCQGPIFQGTEHSKDDIKTKRDKLLNLMQSVYDILP